MTAVSTLIATLASTQQALIEALQDEYYCDDLQPPAQAFGWDEGTLRSFMESGGEIMPQVPGGEIMPQVPGGVLLPQSADAPLAAPSSPPVQLPVDDGPPGRPIILCIGDATVEFGSHVINLPTADVGGKGKIGSSAFVTDPVASDFLRDTDTDNRGVEHGPGWVTLLARDYAWRTTADVINRGYSGYTSALLRQDLPELLSTVRRQDVIGVIVAVGGNDAVSPGSATHVPIQAYGENMAALLAELKQACPRAKACGLAPSP